MSRHVFEIFVKSVLEKNEISADDVRCLHRDIFPDGIEDRDEADILIALDRAVAAKHSTWNAFAVHSIASFVVWTSRPTGIVDHDTAAWLVGSLSAGAGPTALAEAIAFEVVREAERTDGTLLAFVMGAARARLADSLPEGMRLAA